MRIGSGTAFLIMQTLIRPVTADDLADVVRLAHEFAAFEDLSEYCKLSETELAEVIFGEGAFVECLIACDGPRAVGYAIFYPHFSSFRGERGVYLEDIFVIPEMRGSGLGKRLLQTVAKMGRTRGARRMDFQVLDWNKTAIDFYLGHGAVRNDDETHFKFAGEAFDRLSE